MSIIFTCLIVQSQNRSSGYTSQKSRLAVIESVRPLCKEVQDVARYVRDLIVDPEHVKEVERILIDKKIPYYKKVG